VVCKVWDFKPASMFVYLEITLSLRDKINHISALEDNKLILVKYPRVFLSDEFEIWSCRLYMREN
jgi:hypothetical protein